MFTRSMHVLHVPAESLPNIKLLPLRKLVSQFGRGLLACPDHALKPDRCKVEKKTFKEYTCVFYKVVRVLLDLTRVRL